MNNKSHCVLRRVPKPVHKNMPLSTKFLEVLEDGDLFFPLSKWPPIAKEYMLKTHKSHNERYYLMRFLTYNGLRPEIASHWIMREGTYDDSAKRDQAAMIDKAKGTEFFRLGKIFNMRYGRTDSASDPAPETSKWDKPPPEGFYYKRDEPEPEVDPMVFDYETLVDKFPIPRRHPKDSDEDHAMNIALWKAEMRHYSEYLKSKGFRYQQ